MMSFVLDMTTGTALAFPVTSAIAFAVVLGGCAVGARAAWAWVTGK
jgi:uncharacterized membrane protein